MAPKEVFLYYSDYYGYAADMHRKMHESLVGLENEITQLDNFLIKNDIQGEDTAKVLTQSIPTVRKNIIVNFSQIGYMEDSFVALAEYVRKKFYTSVDEMLTNENEKVSNSYAKVSNDLAQTISKKNIKE